MTPLSLGLRYGSACCLALLGLMVAPVLAADDPKGVAFFETKIRPVLVEKCHECHSSQAKRPRGGLKVDSRAAIRAGGTSGPAIVPGDLDASLLYQAISAADGVEPMPPRRSYPPRSSPTSASGSSMGAPDPREGTAAASEAGPATSAKSRDWWSLKPVENPTVPLVDTANADWAQNPIDAFILAKLKEKNLQPAPEADRRTLIRRLSFDLLGLPPTAGMSSPISRAINRPMRTNGWSTACSPARTLASDGPGTGWTLCISPRLMATTRTGSGPTPGRIATT